MLSLLLAAPASGMHPHPRENWMVGVGFGYADGTFELGPSLQNIQGRTDPGTSPQIRFARMLGDRFSVGLNYEGWVIEQGDLSDPALEQRLRMSLQGISVAFSWYPGDSHSAAGGLFLRGGAGLGWGRLVYSTVDSTYEQEQDFTVNETGLALTAAIGYEFRVSRHFALGASINGNYMDIGKDFFDRGWFFPATLALGWYW